MRLIGESAKFEVRADIYNFFNKTNIKPDSIDGNLGSVGPDGTVTSVNSDFGVAGSALGSRTIQLQHDLAFSESVVSKGAPVWAPFFAFIQRFARAASRLDLCVRHVIDQVAEAKRPCSGDIFRTA